MRSAAPTYDEVGPFHGNRAAVRIGGLWGYIDPKGTLVIPARFDRAWPFEDASALVVADGVTFKIARNGRPLPGQDLTPPAGRDRRLLKGESIGSFAYDPSGLSYLGRTIGHFTSDRVWIASDTGHPDLCFVTAGGPGDGSLFAANLATGDAEEIFRIDTGDWRQLDSSPDRRVALVLQDGGRWGQALAAVAVSPLRVVPLRTGGEREHCAEKFDTSRLVWTSRREFRVPLTEDTDGNGDTCGRRGAYEMTVDTEKMTFVVKKAPSQPRRKTE